TRALKPVILACRILISPCPLRHDSHSALDLGARHAEADLLKPLMGDNDQMHVETLSLLVHAQDVLAHLLDCTIILTPKQLPNSINIHLHCIQIPSILHQRLLCRTVCVCITPTSEALGCSMISSGHPDGRSVAARHSRHSSVARCRPRRH